MRTLTILFLLCLMLVIGCTGPQIKSNGHKGIDSAASVAHTGVDVVADTWDSVFGIYDTVKCMVTDCPPEPVADLNVK